MYNNNSDPCLSLEWIESNTTHCDIYDSLGLQNPNLLKYLNVIRASNNRLGFISEYYTINLSNYKSYSIPLNIFNTCKQILLGLEYLNSKDITHTKLSLQSVLIDNFNNVKLGHYASSINTLHNYNLDDILYLDPETVVYHSRDKNITSDIWSLGIILLQLLDVTYIDLLSSLSDINLIYASNIAIAIIYHKLLEISQDNVGISTIGLDIEVLKSKFSDFNSILIPRLRNWYTESEISVIEGIPLLYELLKFITGFNIIERYYKQLMNNENPEYIKLLSICYKCLIINNNCRPTACQLLDCFYVTLSDIQNHEINLSHIDTFDLYLHSNIAKYNTLVPSKYHCNSVFKVKCPMGIRMLRKLRVDATITPIAGIYAFTIRPSCGYSRLLSHLYTWLRMCRFDHILTQHKEYRKIILAEARIDFPVSHRLLVYLIALDITNISIHQLKIDKLDNIIKQTHKDNYSVSNELSTNRVGIALNHLINTVDGITYYQGLEDICSVLTSITDNQILINELFSAIVTKFVKSFYCSSFDNVNQLMDKFDHLMRFFDPELYYHFSNLDFKCNSFLIEWLSTLFTRLLSLDKLLVLWDYIIVNGPRYEDYILYVALAMIYSCKSSILLSNDTNKLMKSINTGIMFIHIPMVSAMATRLAGIYKYFSLGIYKNITTIDQYSKGTNSLKSFEKRPIELVSLDEICGIDLQKLHFLKVIGTCEFYNKFLVKHKYPMVIFDTKETNVQC